MLFLVWLIVVLLLGFAMHDMPITWLLLSLGIGLAVLLF